MHITHWLYIFSSNVTIVVVVVVADAENHNILRMYNSMDARHTHIPTVSRLLQKHILIAAV